MSLFLTFLLFLSYNLTQDQPINNNTVDNNSIEMINEDKGVTINHQYYDLHIYIETLNDKPFLVVTVELNKGAYFFSPNEKKELSGKFFMDLGSDQHIVFNGNIIERPLSKIENGPYPVMDKFNKGLKTVYVNTTYKQALQFKSIRNFEVYGRIQFTIEPSCTFEEIPFTISYHDGKLQVKPATKC